MKLYRFLGWVVCLCVLVIGVSWARAAPSAPDVPVDADFEALAAQVGRAEAWYHLDEAAVLSPPPVVDSPVTRALAPSGTITLVLSHTLHLPLVARNFVPPLVERRGIWVTRYDWTGLTQAPTSTDLDVLVANIAGAGFNTIFFQVRAAGDAYYASDWEPWAARLTSGPVAETLGVDPGWDPLAYMLAVAHAAGLELHAYLNVYPAWQSPYNADYGTLWPPATSPPQMFDRFTYSPTYPDHPGEHSLNWTWRQYDATPAPMPLTWSQYLWASPGVDAVQTHIAAVVRDVVARYPVDGVHLDLVRYAGAAYSHDPHSEAALETLIGAARAQWQRDRVTALVRQVTLDTHVVRPKALVSAAVWPYYQNNLGLRTSSGYADYYQDSKGWLATGAVDAIAPMLYGSGSSIPDDLGNWQLLAADFVAGGSAGHVYPGIAGYYDDFAAIADRIAAARQMGAPGHIIFSYAALDARGYWDDLATGPYAVSVLVPGLNAVGAAPTN